MKYIALLLCLTCSTLSYAQDDSCSKLGVWLWHIETTGFTHEILAPNLAALGVERIYVKVADGRVNTASWPELIDTDLVETYKAAGLEVWAWSYNYTENDSLQAEALYMAAKTGYEGYVVDVESEFDGKPMALLNLFFAFLKAKERAIDDGFAIDTFNTYCTTWGNPKDHNYSIGVINPYVTGFMPQTYVEVWTSYHSNISITECIEDVNVEYAELGATKPIHHICATQDGSLTPDQINEFITASGSETSLWRIPGGGTSVGIWQDWQEVDWDQNFCADLTDTESISTPAYKVYPNPTDGLIYLEGPTLYKSLLVYNNSGQLVKRVAAGSGQSFDLSGLESGLYWVKPDGEEVRIKAVLISG